MAASLPLPSPSASPASASANPADAQSAQDLTLFVRTSATGRDDRRIDAQRMDQWLTASLCLPLLPLFLRCKICCSRWSVAVGMTRGAATAIAEIGVLLRVVMTCRPRAVCALHDSFFSLSSKRASRPCPTPSSDAVSRDAQASCNGSRATGEYQRQANERSADMDAADLCLSPVSVYRCSQSTRWEVRGQLGIATRATNSICRLDED